jgi:NAD(P)H-dependent FMN reductase
MCGFGRVDKAGRELEQAPEDPPDFAGAVRACEMFVMITGMYHGSLLSAEGTVAFPIR